MKLLHSSPDVAVIGAGPVGCVTALTYAQQGAKVLLLEAYSQNVKCFAGEWLHPPGVQILQQVGIDLNLKRITYPCGKGFVIFPEDGTTPIQLDYPDGEVGLSCEHSTILGILREAAASHDNIQLLCDTKVTRIDGQKITFEQRNQGVTHTALVNTIVGADGRASTARKILGIPNQSIPISFMAGILLKDVELPFEGFGHVVLGSVGPVLMYRVGAELVRVCLDVPRYFSRDPATLWKAYNSVIPKTLQPAFKQALSRDEVAWAVNLFCSRVQYGRTGLALVGDATGYFHPITATGMTIGFLDSDCLVRSQRFEDYQQERTFRTYVPELLAITLYEVFTKQDESATALRHAIYRLWRSDPMECRHTMQLLSGRETKLLSFSRSFLKGVLLAMAEVVQNNVRQQKWLQIVRDLVSFNQWLYIPIKLALLRAKKLLKIYFNNSKITTKILDIYSITQNEQPRN
ncbi:monooxygenase FAD-binding protein [Calothrix sp. NIES-4071]|nr:monooxygenase FAD-binding protein [Calothrix sp. NIES-4071]BAZ57889.1 monooxygenase FAD-binding protein [Calothrix sp. NIES-4105]